MTPDIFAESRNNGCHTTLDSCQGAKEVLE